MPRRSIADARVKKAKGRGGLVEELNRIALHCASLPRQDDRNPEEIIGYDNLGLPK